MKANQSALQAAVQMLFDLKGARTHSHTTREKSHGRIEERTITVALGLEGHRPVREFLDWPYVRQVFRMTRTVRRQGKMTEEVSYAITSLTAKQLSLAEAARLWRGHWSIENALHYVRDVTFAEDRSQVRTGYAPQAMAAVRNIALTLLRTSGHKNIAAALRTYAGRPEEAVRLVRGTH